MKAKAVALAIATALALVVGTGWPCRSARADGFDAPRSQDERRALFRRGAQLWPIYCNTCHNARTGAEFSATEWNMIMLHMRTQANLPAADARAVLEYLKSSK